MHTGTGHPTVDGVPVDPAKKAFISAAADACGALKLAHDTSGYGGGGWHDSSSPFETSDAIELALDAWYRSVDVPAPTGSAGQVERGWWDAHLEPAATTLRDRVDELREALRDTGFAPDLQVRRGRFAGASDTEVSAVSALAVHHRLGGRIYARGGHHYNVVARDRVVDLCGTATTAGGPAAEVLPEVLLADERIAGLWRRLRGGLGEPDGPTEAPSRLTVVSR